MKNGAIKIAFFGSFRKFSDVYLLALKKAGFEVVSQVLEKGADFGKIREELKKINPDIGIIAYFGKIIPGEILKLTKNGFLNVHPSLLPRWRGPSPIQAAILAGDEATGITIHLATERADAGDILAQKEIPIAPEDTCRSLTERLAKEGATLLLDTIGEWLSGRIMPRQQDNAKATYTKLIKKEDGKVDWSKPADYIERMVRAYDPWPGCYMEIKDQKIKIIKLKMVEVIENPNNFEPGRFFQVDGYPAVACGEKALKLLVVHPEGKKEMSGAAFLHGHTRFFQNETTFKTLRGSTS